VDEAERKREERNRKRREYRARIKANESTEHREEKAPGTTTSIEEDRVIDTYYRA
jgi:hypothetical protein